MAQQRSGSGTGWPSAGPAGASAHLDLELHEKQQDYTGAYHRGLTNFNNLEPQQTAALVGSPLAAATPPLPHPFTTYTHGIAFGASVSPGFQVQSGFSDPTISVADCSESSGADGFMEEVPSTIENSLLREIIGREGESSMLYQQKRRVSGGPQPAEFSSTLLQNLQKIGETSLDGDTFESDSGSSDSEHHAGWKETTPYSRADEEDDRDRTISSTQASSKHVRTLLAKSSKLIRAQRSTTTTSRKGAEERKLRKSSESIQRVPFIQEFVLEAPVHGGYSTLNASPKEATATSAPAVVVGSGGEQNMDWSFVEENPAKTHPLLKLRLQK